MPVLTILTDDQLSPPPNLDRLRELVEVRLSSAADLPALVRGADAVFGWDFFSGALREAWPAADRLRWLHVAAAGVDAMLFPELVDSEVVVTNATGQFDRPIAEFVAAQVLAEAKQLYPMHDLQQRKQWRHRETELIAGRRVLVVGTGGIGRAIARLLRALDMSVTGVGRVARETDPDFGTVLSSDRLAEHVCGVDHLVVIAPLTDSTRGMIDAQVLAALPDGAQVINVGRGALIDEQALIAQLSTGRITAALDVVQTEPLPVDSPLWELPNVHLSPHMSGDVNGWRDRLAEQFEANLRRWLAGDELHGVVDKRAGYVRHG
ncbi:D-2-hydroxyacid dehydrogenase [Naumannella halotolerans]|uniref:D-2-hydroxyacid dehydrogenase n=1 Tax=Naumannella halotolerans TaxID=993414 RepID=UPI00370D4892